MNILSKSACWQMRPEQENLPSAKKLAFALPAPYLFKNELRINQHQIFKKIKNSQPELRLSGSYKKECKIKELLYQFILVSFTKISVYCHCTLGFLYLNFLKIIAYLLYHREILDSYLREASI